ncbi:zinc finger protein 518A [Rhincodon typus]|uniref:zinc finger protein 518A n=1 Tax=Rhincodon typus TaxID=259920 RepID=UPI00202EB899|nr:zinc finger protein 518A [Rhincodon typus]XP_048464626.1 zinc finger protein 518A [Rhincodon typus]XP_048464627.1 zinc finger protein 518A [Rhincodon typus]XP_048464628.1 zinc finger protein 518A [Rhincodon typus]XP_048464629.1 zinc finger protein 518A [Rhincodon typus]
MQSDQKNFAQINEANAFVGAVSKRFCRRKLTLSTGNILQKDKGAAQKCARVSTIPSVTLNNIVNNQSCQELKFKLKNVKVVLSRLDVQKSISPHLVVNDSKTSLSRCQTARKSMRRGGLARVDHPIISFKDSSLPQLLGDVSKTSQGVAKGVLVKVLRFSCEKCKDSAEYNPKQLLKHYQELHAADLPVYPCELCSFTANDFQTLSQHRLKHRTPLLKCEVCNDGKMYTLQELRKHLNWKHGVNGNFRCEKCRFSTKDQGTFIQHIHRHDVIQYKCGKCEHVSYTKGEFQRHLVVHTGAFPFCCQYCKYGATRKDYIIKHINAVHKGLTESSSSKTEVDSCQKGKLKSSAGLKLVLKRYKNGVSRKVQWRKKRQILHLSTTKDNAKRSDDATKKFIQPVQPSPVVDVGLNEKVVGPKDANIEKDDSCRLWSQTSSLQKAADVNSSKQTAIKIVPFQPPVLILKNKLSVPPNYSAQFMGFKVVNGKQHLVLKLIPTCKQNASASDSQTKASNDGSLCLPQNTGNSDVKLPCTQASHVNAEFIRLSNILTNQPHAFMVTDNSTAPKIQTSVPQISHTLSITSDKFAQVKTIEPLTVGMNSSLTGKLLLPTSSLNLIESTISKTRPDNQIKQNKTATPEGSSLSDSCSSQTFVSSTINQISSKGLQCLKEQASSGKMMSPSDCDASLQSIKGCHLPFIHNYAKVKISTSNQSSGLIVQGNNSKPTTISQPSVLPQSSFKDESSSGQPHNLEAHRIHMSSLQQLQCIVTSQASTNSKYDPLSGKVSTASTSSSSEPSSTSISSQLLLGCQNPGSQGMNEFNSPMILQIREPSEIVEESDVGRKSVASKNITQLSTVCTSSTASSSNVFSASSELGAETLNPRCGDLCSNSVVECKLNSCYAVLSTGVSEQSICPINVEEPNQVNHDKCLHNLNLHSTEVPILEKCESEASKVSEMEFKNVHEIPTGQNCMEVQRQHELKCTSNRSSTTDWIPCLEGNAKFHPLHCFETISSDSSGSQEEILDYSRSESFSEISTCLSKPDVEMMDCSIIDNKDHSVTAEGLLEEQVSERSVSPVMPRITSVFSLQTGDGMSCLAPEENQLLLDALKASSIFGDENSCSGSQSPQNSPPSFPEKQTSISTATNKMDLHNYSIKQGSWSAQLDCLNDSCDLSTDKSLGEKKTLQTLSPPVSSSCMPPNVEKLNTLLKTHSAEIINQQLLKDAIRTSANVSSNSAVAPVTLLGPLRLAGITKSVLIQPSQKSSAVPLHLTKQSRLHIVSGGSVPQPKVVTANSASLPDKGSGLILTFGNGTLGAVASIVCGGTPPTLNGTSACVQGQTPVSAKITQNTCSLTSDSRVDCMKTTPVNSLSFNDTLPKDPVSTVFDHHSYAKLAFDINNSNTAEKGALNINDQDKKIFIEPLENITSSVSNNSPSVPLRQGTVLGCENTPSTNSENVSDQQTVVLQCIAKKPTETRSEDAVTNFSPITEENGPFQKKIFLRFIKSSNGESGMKSNQLLTNSMALHSDAAGDLTKSLQQPSQTALFAGGSPCILLPVNKPVPSTPANDNNPPQLGAQTSLKLPIPPAPRSSSIRSAEKRNANKVSSVSSLRSATKPICRWDDEESDELWQPRKSCNEKLVFRYSKRLKKKLENSENQSKTVSSSFNELQEIERERKNPPEVKNIASRRSIVKTLRLVPFDHGQLIRCPRRNQPVIVLNHPDVDVPEVVNVMKTIKKCKGNVLKVVLSKRTICALLDACSSLQVAEKGFLLNQCKKIKPVSPVKERYVLKLKLKKTSKNNYQIVKTVSNKAVEAKFSCWFCGRIFDNQEDWVGHGQRHLMEATRDWNSLTC